MLCQQKGVDKILHVHPEVTDVSTDVCNTL